VTAYLDPTREALRAFGQRGIAGPVVMLNLLRFRATADYAASPALAPPAPITGAQAYRRYLAHASPLIEARGGAMTFLGAGGAFVIGPADERWDAVMLVRYPTTDAFFAFVTDPAYQAGVGHRNAALEDSRLLPCAPADVDALFVR
jgi:uncharacterized protein (DUF1330 family)